MRIMNIIFILLLLPIIVFGKVDFFKGSLHEAKRTAAVEGKPYFIDFYAKYCLPCKLMDQTTFMDNDLGEYISGNYVALKLNIDAFDAYEVRNEHEVKALPTVMIFSSDGKLLESYAGSLTATALRKLLEKHNLPKNQLKTTPSADETEVAVAKPKPKKVVVNTPPKPKVANTPPRKNPVKPKTVKTQAKPKVVKTTAAPPRKNPAKPVVRTYTATQKPAPKKLKKTESEIIGFAVPKKKTSKLTPVAKPKQVQPKKPVKRTLGGVQTKARGLYEFSANRHPSMGYAIQIGVFAEYGNVLMEVEKIQELFPNRKVIVHIDEMNGTAVYRVAVGTFSSYVAAKNYLPKVKGEGFECFVKNLSGLK